VGVEVFDADGQTDGRTDMTKLIVAFRNFVNAPKKELITQKVISTKYQNYVYFCLIHAACKPHLCGDVLYTLSLVLLYFFSLSLKWYDFRKILFGLP
jgi:hypothetical protein